MIRQNLSARRHLAAHLRGVQSGESTAPHGGIAPDSTSSSMSGEKALFLEERCAGDGRAFLRLGQVERARRALKMALAAGRNPAFLLPGNFQPDHVIEVQPTGPNSGVIVWEWHVWDHLVQDHDPEQMNHGEDHSGHGGHDH